MVIEPRQGGSNSNLKVFFFWETMYIRTTMIHKGKNQGDLSKPALCSSKRVLTAQISGVVVDVVDHKTQILKL